MCATTGSTFAKREKKNMLTTITGQRNGTDYIVFGSRAEHPGQASG
jgi:hypothetical protein